MLLHCVSRRHRQLAAPVHHTAPGTLIVRSAPKSGAKWFFGDSTIRITPMKSIVASVFSAVLLVLTFANCAQNPVTGRTKTA
jgi:hypothetical protein